MKKAIFGVDSACTLGSCNISYSEKISSRIYDTYKRADCYVMLCYMYDPIDFYLHFPDDLRVFFVVFHEV